ncbi:hypothetical protein RGQ29_015293 [Quercus rubra]|uniref:B12D-like protein n=1 Tax=Quercus rubra TaxID=3512 RepID=A0AAN7J301_QUERU|nr:hypothetical protein RGQ29_015293 [Quercus rubra]
MASATANRWLRPEVLKSIPTFATVGVAVGICAAPTLKVTKDNRAAEVLGNFEEGEKYSQHAVRKFVRNRSPQIMPSINKFFSDPNIPN